jgi:hypothetical protein
VEYIVQRVAELSCTSKSLSGWASDLEVDTHPRLSSDRQATIRAEIDACCGRIFGLTRQDLDFVLDPRSVMGADYPSETFRVLKDKEVREFGEYRTRRLVLEAWDRIFGAG